MDKISFEKFSTEKLSPGPSITLQERIQAIGLGNKHICRKDKIPFNNQITNAPHISLETFADHDLNEMLRKTDLRLIPMLSLLYLLSFLDRNNTANAKIEGLQEDLNMTASQCNWCLAVLFFTNCVFAMFTASGMLRGISSAMAWRSVYDRAANRRREQACAEGEHWRYTPAELSEMGTKALTFRYTL